MMKYIAFLWSILFASACNITQTDANNVNPPADGFDIENSDEKAIAIADEVMEAMGGAKIMITPAISNLYL